jgi:hypothetical protein
VEQRTQKLLNGDEVRRWQRAKKHDQAADATALRSLRCSPYAAKRPCAAVLGVYFGG